MNVTIKDIARAVGVSPSTVSRVVNGNASISRETRDKIIAVMEELDYHPNSLARNLVNGSTRCIGLILNASDEDSYANAFFDRSVYAIEKTAQARGYTLLIANDGSDPEPLTVQRLVLEKKVDGLILPSSLVRPGLVSLLTAHAFPFVVLGEPGLLKNETCWVDADNEEGARDAVLHLLSQGYQNIAFLLGSRKNIFARNRISGYRKGLTESGMAYRETLIRECAEPEEAETAAEKLLDGSQPPDAFLCSNNLLAYYVLQALKKRGLRIPEDAGLATFDNYPLAQYLDPPLTAVDVDTYGLGEQAAYQLLKKIKKADSAAQHTLMTTRLLIRRSSQRKE